MEFLSFYFLRIVLVALSILKFSLAIDESSAEESACFKITNAVDPNDTWVNSVEKWYYPFASRLDLYRSAHDLLETDYENIPEYSLYYNSCLEWTISSEGYTLMGYNGKTRRLKTSPVAQGTADFKSEWSQGMTGRAYTTLTDNKSFIFTAACFADNQMSWNVFSTTPTLDDATKDKIFEHAQSLGYNAEYFTEVRYDSCKSQLKTKSHFQTKEKAVSSKKGNSSRGQISTKTLKPGHGFFFCSACLRMCPNLQAKNEVAENHFKKLEKFEPLYSDQ